MPQSLVLSFIWIFPLERFIRDIMCKPNWFPLKAFRKVNKSLIKAHRSYVIAALYSVTSHEHALSACSLETAWTLPGPADMQAVCKIIKWINLIFYESQDTTHSSLKALVLSARRPLRLLCSLVKSCSFWQAAAFPTPSLLSDISANVTKLQFMRCNMYAAPLCTTHNHLLQANSFSEKSMTAEIEPQKPTDEYKPLYVLIIHTISIP